MTPFEALNGFPPPTMQSYIPRITRVEALDSFLSQREAILGTLRKQLVVAQEKVKFQADKYRRDKSFYVGNWVYLKLQPSR